MKSRTGGPMRAPERERKKDMKDHDRNRDQELKEKELSLAGQKADKRYIPWNCIDTAPVNANKCIMTGSRSMEKGNRDKQEVGITKGHEET